MRECVRDFVGHAHVKRRERYGRADVAPRRKMHVLAERAWAERITAIQGHAPSDGDADPAATVVIVPTIYVFGSPS
jgi:hypothetical protein